MISNELLDKLGFTERYGIYELDADSNHGNWHLRVGNDAAWYGDTFGYHSPNIKDLFDLVYEQGRQAGIADAASQDVFAEERDHAEY